MCTDSYFDLNTLNNLTKGFVTEELEKLQKEIYRYETEKDSIPLGWNMNPFLSVKLIC